MQIYLYNLNVSLIKRNKINKNMPSTKYFLIEGELRDSIDIMNPEIIFDISNTANITVVASTPSEQESLLNDFRTNPTTCFNYVHIPFLNRYYFVKNITLLRRNIFQVSLHVDVLQMYTFIYSQKAFVSRNATHYDPLLPDARRIILNEQEVKYITLDEITPVGHQYIKFDPYFTTETEYLEEHVYNIVAIGHTTGVNKTYIEEKVGDIRSFASPLPNVRGGLFAPVNAKTYLLNLSETAQLLHYTNNVDSSLIGSISGIFAYPFNFKDFYNDEGWAHLETTFSLGQTDIWNGHNAHNLRSLTSGYLINTAFVLDESYAEDFNDLQPYSQYELYIPYYGYYTLNYNALRGHTLYLYYVINYQIGSATVILYDDTEDSVITTLQTQLGIEIPKNTSNVKDVVERHNANNVSLGLNLVASALSVVVGIATENPVAVAGGLISAGTGIGKYTHDEKTNLYKEQIQLNGSTSPIFSPQEAYIKKTKKKIQYDLDANFLSENGGVYNQLVQLSSLMGSGYTEIAEIPNITYSLDMPTDNEINEIIDLLKSGVNF